MTLVLVVDDEAAMLVLASEVLADAGFEVITATHGGEALDVLNTASPDLILLDMRMPVCDGVEFARRYHERSAEHDAPTVPIILFTAATDAEASARQVGANAYLAKPFDIDDLVDVVRRHTAA